MSLLSTKGKDVKRGLILLVVLAIQFITLQPVLAQDYPIKVAIYDDEGTGPSKLNVSATLSDTTLFDVTWVMGADIRAGILQNFDVLIHPGGSGSGQGGSLEEAGRDSVRAFIARGGGCLGICAGAYLVTSHYTWSLDVLNAKVIDTAHWNRGGGQADILFSDWGQDFFGFVQDTVMIEYRQGPLMAPANLETLPGYIEVGTFQTEFTENGAPSGVMIGTSAFAFSRYQDGRVVAFSPHPEITTGREYMIPDAVQWVAGDDPYLGIASPLNQKPLEASTVALIEWVAEDVSDPVLIEFSSDNGVTWLTVASGQVDPYDWTVPDTPAEFCVLRVTSLTDGTLVDTVHFSITPPPLSIYSVQTGVWSDPATWDGNVVPTAADNVVIGSAHIVTVDVDAGCLDISFVDGSGKLGMQADLYIYGDFNRFDTSVNPFYSGSNLWIAGARMIFTGDAEVQTITNLGLTSSSPYPFRLRHIVIDKSDGKFTTQPVEGLESGYRLGIGDALEVVNGTFELGRRDDIEGRQTSGTATTPEIIVFENGIFDMLGSYSHIRRGNFTGFDSSKIGKMTVYGEAYLACSSSNRINIADIDVEDGGLLKIPYFGDGGGMGASRFNPGTVTIKDGGTFSNPLNTNYWYDNTTTPNQIALLEGGIVESTASAPYYPALSVNEGTFVYSRSSSDQAVFDMDYHNLQLKNSSSGAMKTWTLGADRLITGELNNSYSAETVILADAAHSLTVQGMIRLTSGEIDNSDTDVSLTIGDGAVIRRIVGTLSTAPVFAGTADVVYASQSTQVTTGPELPADTNVVNDLELVASEGVILGADVTVNGTCTVSENDLNTGAYTLTLGPSALLVESDGNTVIGTVTTTRTASQSVNETFGNIGIEINAAGGAPGVTTVTRVTGTALSIDGTDGIERYFDISPANNSALDATVVFHYDESELGGIDENYLAAYSYDDGSWTLHPSTPDATGNSVACTGVDLLATMTLGSEGTVATMLHSFFCAPAERGIEVSWKLSDAGRIEGFKVSREKSGSGEFLPIDAEIVKTGNMAYLFVDNACEPGTEYRYRIDAIDEEGTKNLFVTESMSASVPKLELSQNYPNPFNPATVISYSIPHSAHVVLDIFDPAGRRVTRLINEVQSPGVHTKEWTGLNAAGNPVASGVYFYKLVTGKESITKKMVLLR